MRKPAAARLALAAALLLAPGCAFAQRAMPLDASGMDYTLCLLGDQFDEQVDRTHDAIAGLPRSFSRHVEESWRHLMVDPTDM